MQNCVRIKGLVFTIIILIMGVNVLPIITGEISTSNDTSLEQMIKKIETMQTSSYSPDINHIFTTMDTPSKAGGIYMKKSVTDNVYKQIRKNQLIQTSSNTSISQPLNNDIFKAGDIIKIIGTANGSTFQNYTIQWGFGENPSEWFSTGISLVNGGQIGLVNDTLAFWNTSFVLNDDFFTLRLTVNYTTNQSHALRKNIYLDSSLKQGWPQKINWDYFSEPPGGYIWGGMVEPVVCDINNDENMEIIVYVGGNPAKLYVFNQNGSILEGWPQMVEVLPGGNLDIPSVADINNDGYKEIFVNGVAGIYIYRYDGSLLRLINLSDSSYPTTATVLSDLNNDGSIEIIKKFDPSYNGPYFGEAEKIAVLDSNGTMLQNWPQSYYNRTGPDGNQYSIFIIDPSSTPAVGNFDNDPEKEVVVVTPRNVFDDPTHPSQTWHVEGSIIVFNLDGTVLSGFPVNIDGCPISSPAIADINNDGYDEIILATTLWQNPHSGLYVLDRFGKNFTGFPQLLGHSISTSPAVADFNDDGFLEIVVSSIVSPTLFRTYIFNYQGTVLSGWPQNTAWADYRSPIVGDITGDTIPDIITTAGNGFIGGGVYAWTVNGTPLEGFPKVTEVDAQASATIADIDSDGYLELIASSDWDIDLVTQFYKNRSSIYVWDLNSSVNSSTMEWPTFHHDNQRSGMYPLVPREAIVGNITGGFFKVKATIKNIGGVTANNINWNITLTGFVLFGRKTAGSISVLTPGDEQMITSKPIIGFGKTVIKIIVTYPGNTVSAEQNARIILFVMIMK